MNCADFVTHILWMRKSDPDYARQALIDYDRELPWLGLMDAVRAALQPC